jgi:hypothetical protein
MTGCSIERAKESQLELKTAMEEIPAFIGDIGWSATAIHG